MVRTFNYLFDKIRALNKNDEICKIKASYLEIYNEKAIDLLNQGSKRLNLPLRWNKQNQAFNVENLFVFSCSETQDLVNILVEGKFQYMYIISLGINFFFENWLKYFWCSLFFTK